MATHQNREVEQWHLDKKVPIALLTALLIQFGGMMMYVGTLKSQTEDNGRRITQLEGQKVSERLSSLEAQVGDTKALILRIEGKVDRWHDDTIRQGQKR